MRFSDTENNMTFCIGVCWLGTPNMESLQKIMMNLNILIRMETMEANELMRYAYELLQGHSNEECARILREVVAECQVCIKNCEEGVFENMLK